MSRGGREVTKFYTGMLRPIHFTVFLTRKAFLSSTAVHVASSLKPLSQTLCGPLDLISGINNQLMFEVHVLISFMIPPS